MIGVEIVVEGAIVECLASGDEPALAKLVLLQMLLVELGLGFEFAETAGMEVQASREAAGPVQHLRVVFVVALGLLVQHHQFLLVFLLSEQNRAVHLVQLHLLPHYQSHHLFEEL